MELENMNPKFRTMKLEDGERVVMLRGARRKSRDGWPSNQPHAGDWSGTESYALVPANRPGSRARAARAFDAGLSVKPTDDAVLVTGPHALVSRLLAEGPVFFRARVRRSYTPEQLAEARLRGFALAEKAAQGDLETTIAPDRQSGT